MEGARPAGPDDHPRCVALVSQAQDELRGQRGGPELLTTPPAGPRAPAALVADWSTGPGTLWVGQFEGVTVGLAAGVLAEVAGRRTGRLECCYVEPEARGVGVGAALVGGAARTGSRTTDAPMSMPWPCPATGRPSSSSRRRGSGPGCWSSTDASADRGPPRGYHPAGRGRGDAQSQQLGQLGHQPGGTAGRRLGRLVGRDPGRPHGAAHRRLDDRLEEGQPLGRLQLGASWPRRPPGPGARPARPGNGCPARAGGPRCARRRAPARHREPWPARATQSSRSAVTRWSSASWRALAMTRPSSSKVTVRGPATTVRSSRRRRSRPAAWAEVARSFQAARLTAGRSSRPWPAGVRGDGRAGSRPGPGRSARRWPGAPPAYRRGPAARPPAAARAAGWPARRCGGRPRRWVCAPGGPAAGPGGRPPRGRPGDRFPGARRRGPPRTGGPSAGDRRHTASPSGRGPVAGRRPAVAAGAPGPGRPAPSRRGGRSSPSRRRRLPGARVTETSGPRGGAAMISMRSPRARRSTPSWVGHRHDLEPSRPDPTSARYSARAAPSGTSAATRTPLG